MGVTTKEVRCKLKNIAQILEDAGNKQSKNKQTKKLNFSGSNRCN